MIAYTGGALVLLLFHVLASMIITFEVKHMFRVYDTKCAHVGLTLVQLIIIVRMKLKGRLCRRKR